MARRSKSAEFHELLPTLLKGRVVIVDHGDGTATAQAWPRKRGKPKSPAQLQAVEQWTTVAKWRRDPIPADRIAAGIDSAGTTKTWADLYSLACYGKVFQIVRKDGTIIMGARVAYQNIQALLDTIDNGQGVLLFRGADAWLALQPGTAGQALVMGAGGLPVWGAGGSGTGGDTWTTSDPGSLSSSAYAAKGALVEPLVPITVKALQFRVAEVAGATYKAQIWQLDGYTLSSLILDTAEQTATISGNNTRLFQPAEPAMLKGDGTQYAVLHIRTDKTGTTSSGAVSSTYDPPGAPVQQHQIYVRLASIEPAAGDTLDHGAGPFQWGAQLQF